MEIATAGSRPGRWHFFQLVFKATKTHRMRILSMLRNYILFYLSSHTVRIFMPFGRALKLGKNVRVQKAKSIQIYGDDAQIELGHHSIIYENARLEVVGRGSIRIGECSVLGDCRISARENITIGHRALLSWNVFIQDYDSHPLLPEIRAEQVKRICRRFYPRFSETIPEENEEILLKWIPPTVPIIIGDDVWVGAGAIVLKGAQIGHGSIVASGAVVTAGVYPARSVLAGNPARVIKSIAEHEVTS
jgi:acetyltransferase-like isoleucine patch superfamily enzyme